MSTVYVRLAGGLGNQLYQLAAALHFSAGQSQDVAPLAGALSRYNAARKPESLRLLDNDWQAIGSSAMARLVNLAVVDARAGRWLPLFGCNDTTFQRKVGNRAPAGHALLLDGYFQRDWNRESFASAVSGFSMRPAAPSPVDPGECVVHVRGGDFLTLPLYDVTDLDYYVRAMSLASAAAWSRFAILSDDLVHAGRIKTQLEQRLTGISIRLLQSSDDSLADFRLLRDASARIIGNSTFAWWATALDARKGSTWSPARMVRTEERDFFLDWENAISTPHMERESSPKV